MRVIFLLFASAAMDFMVALGEGLNPCHVQQKKRTQTLNDLYLALTVAACSTVLQGKLTPSYSRRYLANARPGSAQEAGLSYLVFSENRFPSEPCHSAMK